MKDENQLKIRVNALANIFDNEYMTGQMTLAGLTKLLSKPTIRTEKKGNALYLAEIDESYIYASEDGIPTLDRKKSSPYLRGFRIIAFDLDDGESLEKIQAKLEWYTYWIHSSWSHLTNSYIDKDLDQETDVFPSHANIPSPR